MEPNKASLTAQLTAFARAYHATHAAPKIFDDFLAPGLFTEPERAFFEKNLAEALKFLDPERAAACPDQASALADYMRVQGCPTTLSRSRYTEDVLAAAEAEGVTQYVILGAGLETFAFRRPAGDQRLQVFEVDHPATQAFKRARLAELGWALPPHLHFVPVDFAHESLPEGLQRSTYDSRRPAFFSWLGVTYYLAPAAVRETWRAVAGLASAGSGLVFDYLDADAFVPERAAVQVQRMQAIVRMAGEPMQAGFDPAALAGELAAAGLTLVENLSPAAIQTRYFAGRADGYAAAPHMHFARAVVA